MQLLMYVGRCDPPKDDHDRPFSCILYIISCHAPSTASERFIHVMDHIEKDVIAKRSEAERHVRAQLCICNPCILPSDWCDMVVELFDQLIVVWMIAEDLIECS